MTHVTDSRAATDAIRNALTPIAALLALLDAGIIVDGDAVSDAQEGLRRVLGAVERLEVLS